MTYKCRRGGTPAKEPVDTLLATHSNWQIWPHLRWSFQHIEDILPCTKVRRHALGTDSTAHEVHEFIEADARELIHPELITMPRWVGARNALEYLNSVYTDAFLVVHKGRIVCEKYFGNMTRDRLHITQSITKSFVAMTAACVLDVRARRGEKLTERLLPELIGSGYEGATLSDLLDMTCATDFSEAYAGEGSPAGGRDMTGLCVAMQWHPVDEMKLSSDTRPPATIRSFLKGLQQRAKQAHGKVFDYQSTTSECLCWAVEAAAGGRASGFRFEDMLSSHIWAKLGQESDGSITIDREGVCGVSGGFSCTARDLARVGQMLVNNGRNLAGDQVLPQTFVCDCLAFDEAGHSRYCSADPYGQAYRNNFWIFGKEPEDASFMACGIHGQTLWAHPKEELVIVKMASSESPWDDFEYSATMEVLLAIRVALRTRNTAF
eukprot:TRINITY_DN57653_c0_g1_i1.p1 TRINITY_DN57653_c0_g1~~TRINITY_DN57653_c0_g1_i1.p1  ORF type:complete len:435 (-),score=36.96 TRINITY_DN57653_c0_g1_i1:92-1396(-)